MLFTFKREFIKLSADLQTALAAGSRAAEGQWLEEKLEIVELRIFQAGTLLATVSRTEGKYLPPYEDLLQIKHQSNNTNNSNNNHVTTKELHKHHYSVQGATI
jgi:hypothetical protein